MPRERRASELLAGKVLDLEAMYAELQEDVEEKHHHRTHPAYLRESTLLRPWNSPPVTQHRCRFEAIPAG